MAFSGGISRPAARPWGWPLFNSPFTDESRPELPKNKSLGVNTAKEIAQVICVRPTFCPSSEAASRPSLE
jgi:hypothetical protein